MVDEKDDGRKKARGTAPSGPYVPPEVEAGGPERPEPVDDDTGQMGATAAKRSGSWRA